MFTNAKAGMADVDAEKIKQTVYELSKDSPHFKEEQRKTVCQQSNWGCHGQGAAIDGTKVPSAMSTRKMVVQANAKAKVARMKAQLAEATPQQLKANEARADALMARLELERDLSRIWMHVDMDSFFASVEERHDPSLKDKNVAGVPARQHLCFSNACPVIASSRRHVKAHLNLSACSGGHEHDLDGQLQCSQVWRPGRHARLHRRQAVQGPGLRQTQL